MDPTTVDASSGLLPGFLEKISLFPDRGHGWEVALVARPGAEGGRCDFTGGGDPRTWLAYALAKDHGFCETAALEVARRLFEPFLPPTEQSDPNATPYGMHGG